MQCVPECWLLHFSRACNISALVVKPWTHAIAIAILSVCPSVRPSVCHTGDSRYIKICCTSHSRM